MDDERIERLLRRTPPGDPPFEPSGRWLEGGERELAQRPTPTSRSWGVLLAAGLAAAAVIAVIMVIAGPLAQLRQQGVGGLIAEVERRGAIRVAIDGGPPQAHAPARGYDGFDLDIAREVAERLGVQLDVVVVPRATLLAGGADDRWDVAISSIPAALLGAPSARATDPYAVVAGAITVGADDPADVLNDLASGSACAVAGSTSEAWLHNDLESIARDTVQPVPAPLAAHVRPTLAECLGGLADGSWRAAVVDRASDVSGAGGVRVLDNAPFEVSLVAVVNHRAGVPEPMIARLNGLFAEMADEGVIADISRRRFAGSDVTP